MSRRFAESEPDHLVLGLVKSSTEERFIFIFPDTPRGYTSLLCHVGKAIFNPELDFDREDGKSIVEQAKRLREQGRA